MNDERWKRLCELITVETDPAKLWILVEELNQEFERREQQLHSVNRKIADHGNRDGKAVNLPTADSDSGGDST